MLEHFPEGLEEREDAGHVEIAGYGSMAHVSAARAMLASEQWPARETDVTPGWETAWQRFHRPVVIGELWLGPSWETPPEGLVSVTIEPGMAFGTGAHPTTRLCIELLLGEPRCELVDLGCGSGVLAVIAARLGFEPVSALDIDAVAVAETRANAARNHVAVNAVRSDCRELDRSGPPLATANLPCDVLAASLAVLKPRRAIVSGFEAGALPAIPMYDVLERRQRDGWGAALLRRDSPDTPTADDYP